MGASVFWRNSLTIDAVISATIFLQIYMFNLEKDVEASLNGGDPQSQPAQYWSTRAVARRNNADPEPGPARGGPERKHTMRLLRTLGLGVFGCCGLGFGLLCHLGLIHLVNLNKLDFLAQLLDQTSQRLVAPLEDSICNTTHIKRNGLGRVIVTRNDPLVPLGGIVGIDHTNYWNTQFACLGHRDVVITNINDKQGIRQFGDFLDPAYGAV